MYCIQIIHIHMYKPYENNMQVLSFVTFLHNSTFQEFYIKLFTCIWHFLQFTVVLFSQVSSNMKIFMHFLSTHEYKDTCMFHVISNHAVSTSKIYYYIPIFYSNMTYFLTCFYTWVLIHKTFSLYIFHKTLSYMSWNACFYTCLHFYAFTIVSFSWVWQGVFIIKMSSVNLPTHKKWLTLHVQ